MIKVIIAEDLNILRKRIVCAINSQTDMKVVAEASTGMEITRLAEACEFDIALIDIEMESREAGINATMDILKLKPESQIIILTLHDSDEMVFKALEGGAVDYIIKSEDTTKVIQHIRQAYEGENVLDSRIQAKLRKEFRRLRKSENNLLFFIRNVAILTPAEKALLKLLVEGYSIKEIANLRFVEITTVKTQMSHIIKKLNVRRTRDIVIQIKEMQLESLLEPDNKV